MSRNSVGRYTQDLSLSTERPAGGTPEPGLIFGHHPSAHAARVPLPRGDHGLAYPQGSVLADLEHAGGRLLCRRADRGRPQVRAVRDNEYRSRIPERIQPVVATPSIISYLTSRSRASAGVCQPNVFLGRVFSAWATSRNSSVPCLLRSVPLGKYWRSKPLVFSLLPRCQGL